MEGLAAFVYDFVSSPIVKSVFFAWLTSQTIKMLLIYRKTSKIYWPIFFIGGGMPSSHTATVASWTLALFLTQGLTPLTLSALLISIIVMRDIIGLKYTVGEHAKLLNRAFKSRKSSEKKLTEDVGHDIWQVGAGLCIGLISALVFAL